MPKRQPRELPRRRYVLELTDELAEYHMVMGAMRGHEIIAMLDDKVAEADAIRMIVGRVIEHDLPTDDLLDLDTWMYEIIQKAWLKAMEETALPPTSGESSEKGSPT